MAILGGSTWTLGRALLLGGSLLTLCLAGINPATALPDPQLVWRGARTEHFTVYSTSTEFRTLRIANALEGFRTVLDSLFPGLVEPDSKPTYVLVFGSSDSLAPYNIGGSSESWSTAGFFADTPVAQFVAIDASPGNRYRRIVYHEYMHHFLGPLDRELPLWFHEGFADYFSSFSLSEQRARIGRPIDEHLEWLRTRPWMPLGWVFEINQGSSEYDETDRAGSFYAHSWLLVHYLLQDGNGAPKDPKELIRQVSPERSLESIVLDAVGLSAEQLDVRLQAYSRQRSLNSDELPLDVTRQANSAELTVVERGEVLTRLGQLQAFVHGDDPAAIEHLRAALALDSARADARAALGFVLHRIGEDEEAAEQFAVAVGSHSEDGSIYRLRALSLLGQLARNSGGTVQPTREVPQEILQARRLFARSLELDPRSVESEIGLGMTYLYESENLEPGIEALGRARQRLPYRPDLDANLAVLLVRADRLDEAVPIVRRLNRAGSQSKLVGFARGALLGAKGQRAAEFERAQRIDEAIAVYDSMLELATTPTELARLEARQTSLRQLQRFNEAVALANAGRPHDALTVLEPLQDELTDPRQVAEVRSLIDKIRKRAQTVPPLPAR